jgi:hypothetical protein
LFTTLRQGLGLHGRTAEPRLFAPPGC